MSNLNKVDTTVNLAGQKIHFNTLTLSQKFNEHHHCEVLVNFEELDIKWMNDPVKIIKYIGESLTIEMSHSKTGETNVFLGIINNVSFVGSHGAQNNILIQATSPTILLDGKPTMDSFVDKSLDDIVNESVDTSGNNAEIETSAAYANPIDYICQYGESTFEFLNRLSCLYGENFYYDGSVIKFGKLELGEATKIMYDVEMTSLNLEANMLPPKFNRYSYLVHDDDEKEKSIIDDIPSTSGYLKVALDRSTEIFTSDANLPLDSSVNDASSLQQMVDIERTRTISNMLVLKGISQTCKVKIGEVISIIFPAYMTVTTSPGDFVVTEVTHKVDQKGKYENSFSGVPATLECVPTPAIKIPAANPQQATVKSNADPKNQGRIQVQFQWQKATGKTTNWIRVQTPDAGGSDKVPSNRGLMTIPEEGDLVMIGFEYGDPNKPYSAGSLFSSKSGGGGGEGNKTKSLVSRSGNAVILNDALGSVTIQDKAGSDSKIVLDGEKNISITADTSITLQTGDSSIVMLSDGTITISGKDIIQLATKSIALQSDDTIDLVSDGELKAFATADATFASEAQTLVTGNKKSTLQATGEVVLDGAIIKLN